MRVGFISNVSTIIDTYSMWWLSTMDLYRFERTGEPERWNKTINQISIVLFEKRHNESSGVNILMNPWTVFRLCEDDSKVGFLMLVFAFLNHFRAWLVQTHVPIISFTKRFQLVIFVISGISAFAMENIIYYRIEVWVCRFDVELPLI